MTLIGAVVGRGTAASKPASPYEGWLYYETDNERWMRYSGAAWEESGLGGAVDGADIANVANDQTTPGLPTLFPIAIAGGAAADTDITIDGKHGVIDVWAQHTGGAGEASDTIQVKNGANAITDAMDWSGADNAIVRASSIDDAQYEIADGGTLRVTTTDDDSGGDVGAGTVYVLAIPVA